MSDLNLVLKFVGRISETGGGLIIWIPKDFHTEAKKLRGKQVRVVVTEAI